MTDYFAFEKAASVLNDYVNHHPGKQFQRAYHRVMAVVDLIAKEFAQGREPTVEEMSYAWEDLEVAFKGHGEPCLSGALTQMWATVGHNNREAFASAVERAFAQAEEATDERVARRYLPAVREQPVRNPFDGGSFPVPVIPLWGPATEAFTYDHDGKADALVRHWQRMVDRLEEKEQFKKPKPRVPASENKDAEAVNDNRDTQSTLEKPKLTLVVNNPTGELS